MKLHQVQPGECLLSLAATHGLTLERLAAANPELCSQRVHAGILLPGDVVCIPPREIKHEACATGARHRFRRRSVRAEIRVQIVDRGRPRRNERYELIVDGVPVAGLGYGGDAPETDDHGFLRCEIPPTAQRVVVLVGDSRDEYELRLGHLNPIDSVTGLHGRLANLGTYSKRIKASYGEHSRDALARVLDTDPADLPEHFDDLDVGDELSYRYGC